VFPQLDAKFTGILEHATIELAPTLKALPKINDHRIIDPILIFIQLACQQRSNLEGGRPASSI